MKPDFEIVAKAVLSTYAMGQGMTEKQITKFVDEKYKTRVPIVEDTLLTFMKHQIKI
jgi:hypothetical protein